LFAINLTFTANAGISAIITYLEKQKRSFHVYNSAIKNGEKFASIKTLYVTLKMLINDCAPDEM
jgi:hypothetical protein